jgi:enediyne biosynthesis protein E4
MNRPLEGFLGPAIAMAGFAVVALRVSHAGNPAPARFEDVVFQSGVNFVLDNFPTPGKHMIETMAGGLAVFDFDGDGKPDLFLTNGAPIPGLRKTEPRFWNRLYHNEGGLRFRDVTESAGVAGDGYSMGAAAGDYDNDGRVDLFVAGVYRG